MQVALARHRRPLIRAERSELARMIVFVRDSDVLLPDRGSDLRIHERLHRRAPSKFEQIGEDAVLLGGAVRILHDHRLRLRQLTDVRSGGIGLPGDADIFRMIGHAHEIERRINFDVKAHRMLDGLALGVLQSVVRAGDAVSHDPRVDRPASVNVRLAEIGVALRIALRGCLPNRKRNGGGQRGREEQ